MNARAMHDAIVVKRYADAYVMYAKGLIKVEQMIDEFKRIKDIVRDCSYLIGFLGSPAITHAEKDAFIELTLAQEFSAQLIALVRLLIDNKRIDILPGIADHVRVFYGFGEELPAVLKTTFALDLAVIEKIRAALEKHFQRKLKLYIELDGSLLGGIAIQVGNIVIDGSVRRRLVEMHEKLSVVGVN